jgi:ABC-type transporter Mla subunit MlaD
MTENELTAAAERLETIHKQFTDMVLMLIEGFNKMETYLESYATSFEANVASYHATTEVLSTYSTSMGQFIAGMQSVIKTAGDNNVAINETNEHLKALIAKFDSHFGDSAGLEYDN